MQELRSQLQAEEAKREEADDQCVDFEKWWRESEDKVTALESENSDLKQKLAAALTENEKLVAASRDLPEAADLLNQLKAKMKAERKKSTASLADVESILEILEES